MRASELNEYREQKMKKDRSRKSNLGFELRGARLHSSSVNVNGN